MNGTLIDIQGLTTSVTPIEQQDSTDKSYLLTITDGTKQIEIQIAYEKICSIMCR